MIGHPIRARTGVYFNLLESFNVESSLVVGYVLSIFAILAFSLLINELAGRLRFGRRTTIQITRSIASAVPRLALKKLTAFGIFLLFVNLFLWFTRICLSNNIKTNKVIVDASQLVKNWHDLTSTPKVACMLENDQLHNMALDSPEKTRLHRMYEKTQLRADMARERESLGNDRCLITRQPAMLSLFSSDNIFVLGERKMAALFATASPLIKGVFNQIWLNEKESSIFEFNQVSGLISLSRRIAVNTISALR